MAQTLIPFSHENTSELSKSLRRSLADCGHPGIKQTQMLGALARSSGARNFQAYRQKPSTDTDSVHLVALSTVMPSIGELIGSDDQGQHEDRRHQSVRRLIYGLNAKIDLGRSRVEVVLRVESPGQFDSDYEPDESLIEDKALEALAKAIAEPSVDLHQRVELAIDLESHCSNALRANGSAMRIIRLPYSAMSRLWAAAEEINANTRECEDCVAFLTGISEDPARVLQDSVRVRRAIDYLRDIVDCSGQPFMYSWNNEKIGAMHAMVEGWINGAAVEEAERRYVFDNLFVFNPPDAWVRRPQVRWRPEDAAA